MSYWCATLLLSEKEFLKTIFSSATEMIKEVRLKCFTGGKPKILARHGGTFTRAIPSKELQEAYDMLRQTSGLVYSAARLESFPPF